MIQFMERHSLQPIVDKVFPLADAAEAFHRMMNGEQFGKIALLIDV